MVPNPPGALLLEVNPWAAVLVVIGRFAVGLALAAVGTTLAIALFSRGDRALRDDGWQEQQITGSWILTPSHMAAGVVGALWWGSPAGSDVSQGPGIVWLAAACENLPVRLTAKFGWCTDWDATCALTSDVRRACLDLRRVVIERVHRSLDVAVSHCPPARG